MVSYDENSFKAGLAVGRMLWKPPCKAEEHDPAYLTFSSDTDFTLETENHIKNWDGALEYSTTTITWVTWDGINILSSENGKLYLRGTGNTIVTDSYGWKLTGIDIACIGNIETLLDYNDVNNGIHPNMGAWCFSCLFSSCEELINAPSLPATMLSEGCYASMFYSCRKLTQAPELPATTLASNCYKGMFNSCTSLVHAPELPATTLAFRCYQGMFSGTALVNAPVLPATTLASGCYNSMFGYCKSLVNAPSLPATTLVDRCYQSMFRGCSNLITLPVLAATTLDIVCYFDMFRECTKIKLSSSQTDDYVYEYRIPMSGNGIYATNALQYMFLDTGGTFTGTPSINTTYYTNNPPV